MDESGLQEIRMELDEIDQQLIEFLAKRFRLTMEVAEQKRLTDSPVLQVSRATQVQDHYLTLGETLGMNSDFMRDLYHIIHAESCRVQTEVLRESVKDIR